jgi:hypothetical protein
VRSRPPASSPLRVPIHPAPPRTHLQAVIVTMTTGSRPEGPDGSGVNGLTLGPYDSSAGVAGRPGACRGLPAPSSPGS